MGGGAKAPEQPPFHALDIEKIADAALKQDIRRYQSYRYPQFPGLTAVRQAEIDDAYKQLTGPLDPSFQQTFMRGAASTAQQVTGGGDPMSGMGLRAGSFGGGAMSANVTRQAMAKQDYDRTRLEGLIQANPLPGLGLSQRDILGLYVYNTGAQNASAMQGYAADVAAANQAYSNQVATWSTIGNTISSVGSSYGKYMSSRPSASGGSGWG